MPANQAWAGENKMESILLEQENPVYMARKKPTLISQGSLK